MNFSAPPRLGVPRLHLVTDDAVLRTSGFRELAARVLSAHGAALALQLRGHGLAGRELFELAEALVPVARASGAWLLVNDRVDVATCAGVRAVQLGRRSLPIAAARGLLGPDVRIGYSAHDAAEARQAQDDGVDFVLLGAIYPSASHPDRPPAGVELLRRTAAAVAVPVIAIGGITPERVAELVGAGAHGVAVLGGVWRAADPLAAAAGYVAALEAAAGPMAAPAGYNARSGQHLERT